MLLLWHPGWTQKIETGSGAWHLPALTTTALRTAPTRAEAQLASQSGYLKDPGLYNKSPGKEKMKHRLHNTGSKMPGVVQG